MTRSRIAKAALLSVAGAALSYQLIDTAIHVTAFPGPWVDWQTYVNAAARVLSGGSLYSPTQLVGPYELTGQLLVGYAYPPASVALFIPFQGYPFGLAAWLTLNLGLLLTSLWAIISKAWPRRRVELWSLSLLGLCVFPPFLEGMVALNYNVGIAGLIGWASVGLDWRIAGVVGGISGVFKVFPGVLALATPADKRRSVALAFGVAAGLAILTLPLVGLQSWFDFSKALTGAVPDCTGFNVSIACELGPTVGTQVGSLVGILIGGVAAVALVFVTRPYWMAVLSALAVMAPANNLHLHYWTIAYVLLFATLAEYGRMRRRSREQSPSMIPAAT